MTGSKMRPRPLDRGEAAEVSKHLLPSHCGRKINKKRDKSSRQIVWQYYSLLRCEKRHSYIPEFIAGLVQRIQHSDNYLATSVPTTCKRLCRPESTHCDPILLSLPVQKSLAKPRLLIRPWRYFIFAYECCSQAKMLNNFTAATAPTKHCFVYKKEQLFSSLSFVTPILIALTTGSNS